MTVLKIYGQARSRTFRVLWLCKESNIAFEHVPVTIHVSNAEAKETWYRALNPNARVPTIDDDGFVMWESAAINFYLAKKYQSPLWPDTPQGEGRALQWAFFATNDLEPPLTVAFQHRVVFPPERRNAETAAAAEAQAAPKLTVLEDYLTQHRYFGGDRWDLADFMVASIVYNLQPLKYDFGKLPRLGSWLQESTARPGYAEASKLRG